MSLETKILHISARTWKSFWFWSEAKPETDERVQSKSKTVSTCRNRFSEREKKKKKSVKPLHLRIS